MPVDAELKAHQKRIQIHIDIKDKKIRYGENDKAYDEDNVSPVAFFPLFYAAVLFHAFPLIHLIKFAPRGCPHETHGPFVYI